MKKKRILLGLGAFALAGLAATTLASCQDNNKMYTVTFFNGDTEISHTEVKTGYNVEVPAVPTQEGKVFNGWYKDSALTEEFNFGDIITSNTSIYAAWVNECKVTFKDGSRTISTTVVDFGRNVAVPAVPTKDGYTFAGWFSDEALTKEFDFGTVLTGPVTIYSKWEAVPDTYNVKFMNGTTEVSVQEVKENEKATKPTTTPTQEGKRFAYWADADSFAYDFNTPIIGETTLTAVFKDTTEYDTMKAASSNIFATDFYTTPEAVKLPATGAEVTVDNQLKLTTGNVDVEHTTITKTGVYEVFFEVTPITPVNGEALFQIQGTSAAKTEKTEVFGIRSKKDSNSKIVLGYRLDGGNDTLSSVEFKANETYKIKVTLDTSEGKVSYSVDGTTIVENVAVSITSLSSIKFTCKANGSSPKTVDDVAINFTEKAVDPVVAAKAVVSKKITDYKATTAFTGLSEVIKTYVTNEFDTLLTSLNAATSTTEVTAVETKVDAVIAAEKGVATVKAYSAASTAVANLETQIVILGTYNATDVQAKFAGLEFSGYTVKGKYTDQELTTEATAANVVAGATLYAKVAAVSKMEFNAETALASYNKSDAVADGTAFGSFTLKGTSAKRSNSDTFSLQTNKNATSYLEFTVAEGKTATVTLVVSSTGSSDTTTGAFIYTSADAEVADSANTASLSGTSQTTLTYSNLAAGTYKIQTKSDTKGLRIYTVTVEVE